LRGRGGVCCREVVKVRCPTPYFIAVVWILGVRPLQKIKLFGLFGIEIKNGGDLVIPAHVAVVSIKV
jgi:hypothetical protein